MAKDDNPIVVSGRMRVIEFAVFENQEMPARDFCDSLDRRDYDRLFALFVHIANHGETQISPGRFRAEARFPRDIANGNGRLWAFKDTTRRGPGGGKGMFRIGCFRIDQRWILLDGFWKPPQRMWPETQIGIFMDRVREVLKLEKQHNKGTNRT